VRQVGGDAERDRALAGVELSPRGRRVGQRPWRRPPVRDHLDPLGRDAEQPDEVVARRLRHRDHPMGPPRGRRHEHLGAESHGPRQELGVAAEQQVVHGQHARERAADRAEVRRRVQQVDARPRSGGGHRGQLRPGPGRADARGQRQPDHAAHLAPEAVAGLAVDEADQLEVGPGRGQLAEQLARVRFAPAGLTRQQEGEVEAYPQGQPSRPARSSSACSLDAVGS
jgi:hypothetical protein